MLNSFFVPLAPVVLPYRGRQLYMGEIDAAHISMPAGFEDYLGPVVDLLEAADLRKGQVFMTVDEKVVQPGMSQRRPGPHVDGCFDPVAIGWGHDHPTWNHFCNHLPVARMPVIVAASVAGCKAWEGTFDAVPKNNGDLSHLQLGEGIMLSANTGYLLSPDCVHESLTFDQPTKRSFLRLALPVGTI